MASQAIVTEVSAVAARLVPQLAWSRAEQPDPRAERLLHLVLRILSSRMAGDASNATEVTRRKLVQCGRGVDALQYSQLLERLGKSDHGLGRLPAALQLLASLTHTAGVAPLDVSLVPPRALSARSARTPESATAPAPEGAAPLMTAASPSSGFTGSGQQSARRRRENPAGGDCGDELGEKELVRELLFVMQNIDGASLRFVDQRDAFELPASATGRGVPAGVRQLAGRLSELGWLFRQISQYVHAGEAATEAAVASCATSGHSDVPGKGGSEGRSGGGAGGGLVPQALRHVLQGELDEWFQLLAVLEAQRQDGLSLVQLLVWSSQPLQRLLLMAQIVRGCGHLKGGAMTVAIARHERHGDPAVASYVRHLLRAACSPLFWMIREWLLSGELRDVHEEFFIEQRAVPLSQLWEGR